MTMTITDRNLSIGTQLSAKYKGQTYQATLVETEAGPRYRLDDGREFKSPSAAGSAVMNGNACNGWAFWSLAGESTSEGSTKPTTGATTRARGRKATEAKDTPSEDHEGITCAECGQGFATAEAATAHLQAVHSA
jgi:hypothetical protein